MNPFIEAIHWQLSAQHYARQVRRYGKDICDVYATQNDYDLGVGNFPKGKIPIGHPQCLCVTYAVVAKSTDDIVTQLKDWTNGKSDPVLDKWYKEYGSRFVA